MASITWDQVTSFDPSLSVVSVEAQDAVLAHVNAALSVGEFDGEEGAKTRLARIYLAAHLGTLTKNGDGAVGPITSESVGPISRSYASATAASDSLFSSTTWGRAYLQLVRTSPARIPFTV